MPVAPGMLTRVVGVRTPVLQATIARRLLVAYRLDPDAAEHLVPAPFTLHLVNGYAVGWVSLDRIADLRPRGLPAAIGFGSENAAHRIAVDWYQQGRTATGAFVLSRHTDSRVTVALGDRLFPGARERAEFDVADSGSELRVALASETCTVEVSVVTSAGVIASELFASTDEAWRFFRRGAVSYSLRGRGAALDGLDMRTKPSDVHAASIDHASSTVFPRDVGVPDSALVLRDLAVEWSAAPPLW